MKWPRSSTPTARKAISKDGRIGYADVIYPMPADEVSDPAREELEESAAPAEAAGMQVEFGGGLVSEEAEAGSEKLGMMIGFLVLAITLGSLVAAGLPRPRRSPGRHACVVHRLRVAGSEFAPETGARFAARIAGHRTPFSSSPIGTSRTNVPLRSPPGRASKPPEVRMAHPPPPAAVARRAGSSTR